MPIYDITLPLEASLAPWPGDRPYRYRLTCRRREGDAVNLGDVAMSCHLGTHVDAPFHFDDAGATVEALDLERLIGPALVVDLSGREQIRVDDLRAAPIVDTPRLLLRTGAWQDPRRFPDRIPVLEADVPGYLQEQGVFLVGVDLPSVDALDSKDLPIHHALGARGITILESLALAGVPAGRYELIALPLRLVGADGAPVRAVLRG